MAQSCNTDTQMDLQSPGKKEKQNKNNPNK